MFSGYFVINFKLIIKRFIDSIVLSGCSLFLVSRFSLFLRPHENILNLASIWMAFLVENDDLDFTKSLDVVFPNFKF